MNYFAKNDNLAYNLFRLGRFYRKSSNKPLFLHNKILI